MANFKFNIRERGLKPVRALFKRVETRLGPKGFRPVRRTLIVELLKFADSKLASSAAGSPPSNWPPLSRFTIFVKAHRAQRRETNPKMGVDSGVMRASTKPFERSPTEFGVENKLARAHVFNFGGTSKASRVSIGAFQRTSSKGNVHKVSAFEMKIKGGRKVPPRPFFPTAKEAVPIVRRVLRDAEKNIAKGR